MSQANKSVNELNTDLFDPEEIGACADPKEARRKAMDCLARREYGQRELIQKLETAGYDAQLALQTVERLTRDGLQDDRRFIEGFAQSRINQGKGPVRLQSDLRQRGIDAGLIDDVLRELATDWRALARDVRQKKFGTAVPRSFAEKAKQMRFLQYRGFSRAEIEAAVGDRGDDY